MELQFPIGAESGKDDDGRSGWAEKHTTAPSKTESGIPGKRRAKKEFDSLSDWLYTDKHGKKQHKNKCRSESKDLGCNQYFQPDQFNFSAGVCNSCASRFARSIGVPYEWVSYAVLIQDRFLVWYTDKVPMLSNFTQREQIRMALISLNIPMDNQSLDEKDGGAYLRENIKSIGYSSREISKITKINSVAVSL